MNECTLNVSVGPCGILETFIDIDLSERVNRHMWETWKIPERDTKSLILFDFRSCKCEAVNGSIILRKSRLSVTMNGPEIREDNKIIGLVSLNDNSFRGSYRMR